VAFRAVPLKELKRTVTALYNRAHDEGLTEQEFRTLQAMEDELNRRGLVLVEKLVIRENPRGRGKKIRRISR